MVRAINYYVYFFIFGFSKTNVAKQVKFLKRTGTTCLPYYKLQQASVDDVFNSCTSNPNCKGISSLNCETNGSTNDYYQCLSDSQLIASSGCVWEKQNVNGKALGNGNTKLKLY